MLPYPYLNIPVHEKHCQKHFIKTSQIIHSSTLSLHITAYENTFESGNQNTHFKNESDNCFKWNTFKSYVSGSTKKVFLN